MPDNAFDRTFVSYRVRHEQQAEDDDDHHHHCVVYSIEILMKIVTFEEIRSLSLSVMKRAKND